MKNLLKAIIVISLPIIIGAMFIYLPPVPEPSPDYAPEYATIEEIQKYRKIPAPQHKPKYIKAIFFENVPLPQHKPLTYEQQVDVVNGWEWGSKPNIGAIRLTLN